MTDDLLHDMLYFCLIAGVVLVAFLVSFRITIARLKQKNYFLNRDRERYAETMYASKDGYFAFIYPDERIKDPRRTVRERCSRRLAVMLNLKNGNQSSFDDVLAMFTDNDSVKIKKYLALMQDEGIPFDDIFMLKNIKRSINIFGARINGTDGNLYCDMLWFRDLSDDMLKIGALENEKTELIRKLQNLECLINHVNFPLWLRDEKLNVVMANQKYKELNNLKAGDNAAVNDKWENCARNLAQKAQTTNREQKQDVNLVVSGQAKQFEITETPFLTDGKLNRIATVGVLEDVTALDEIKRSFKIHQNAHLEVLSALGTAFAIFNTHQKLIFSNKAFLNLWGLPTNFADTNPSYGEFLDIIRENRRLPEVTDFRSYKNDEEKMFTSLIESKEDLLHIPDGRTFRRVVAPHPNGLIFAFEDVSDRLAATRMANELVSVQQNILDNVRDAVIIFGTDQKVKYFNRSYQKFWKVEDGTAPTMLSLNEVLEMQKPLLSVTENWDALKQTMINHLLNICSRFRLQRKDGAVVEVIPVILSDESLMITYVLN